eukprot:8208671-Karenia_brevis.AAC.1
MRGYITLCTVKAANEVLVAQPLNPLLFRLGRQSYPALLFDVLLGEVDFFKTYKKNAQERQRRVSNQKFLKMRNGNAGL